MIAPKVKTVGSYEAKTHLPALLKEVARGREIIITKRDRPVAKLVPLQKHDSSEDVLEKLKSLRGMLKLKRGETVKDLIEAGRRI